MLQIQAQFVANTGAVCCRYRRSLLLFTLCFCHRCVSATQSDSVRRPIRFRPPSNQIPSAARSDSVRRPIRFRPPSVGGYGILPYPRSPHRGCSGLRCTNQAINQSTKRPTNQPPTNKATKHPTNPTNKPNHQPNTQPTHHLILPIKSSHISNKNTNFANP